MKVDELKRLLELILRDPARRRGHLSHFQKLVWETEDLGCEPDIESIVRDLAYDLDFYEPDKAIRAEDPSLYGDTRLDEEIRTALAALSRT